MPNTPAAIGFLSDAHGNAPATRQAVAQLLRQGATRLIYLGDACGDQVLDELAGLQTTGAAPVPVEVVAGNCDPDPATMARYARYLELSFHPAPGLLKTGGHAIAFAHGHEPALWTHVCALGADIFLHGHTHARADERRACGDRQVRVLCPGSVASPRDGRAPACALLHLPEGRLEWVELE